MNHDQGLAAEGEAAFPHLFSPVRLGPMHLRNRVMMPPHNSAIGNLWGTDEDEATRAIAYLESRAKAGVAWVGGVTGRIQNQFIPGFEPSGISAETKGYFRLPYFVDRVQRVTGTLHATGAVVTCQMTMIGGFPHAPSPRLSGPAGNSMPHVLTTREIAWFVREYGYSAEQARRAGLDGIELHVNHDDLLEWFLSPLTNHRADAYGGSLENRARFVVEVLTAIRGAVGGSMAVGVRLNLKEEVPGGYDAAGGIEIAQYLESTGLIDFIHAVVGTPWGNPSYIQPHFFDPGQWSGLAGDLKRAIGLPVVHTGLVDSPETAERILSAGDADVVGMARAHIADGEILLKAREGRTAEIRPCVGGNECINRRYVDGLPFGCAVNPHASNEVEGPWLRSASPRRLLVVGGGPAGLELAALAAESGHRVDLWEAAEEVGGQLRIAAAAPRHERFGRYLDWQRNRLADLGVKIRLHQPATAADVLAEDADAVAVATGASARRPPIDGAHGEAVLEIRDVLSGAAIPGKRVVVVAQDDHMPPLALADHLSSRGHHVRVVYATNGPAQLLGRYIVGVILGRLSAQQVQFRFMEEVTAIGAGTITTRNVYSGVQDRLEDFDSVVLACGGVSESSLFEELRDRRDNVHLLGDAFAPRRLVFATRQAYALAKILQGPAGAGTPGNHKDNQ
ncbi:N-methylproline demethylase [Zafaria cholistanensis]|uniref:N-methylproline demethylase n=1 Tax=Zafaria cholistanensis TaxID=1682741 RepID=A0A5A7NNB0_9MICC|nr:FAD-dependent oxidoreductase [Zafaria cholistanensis]GER22280.1 N-methylproline demethylase [Zafaria cholistanensis]